MDHSNYCMSNFNLFGTFCDSCHIPTLSPHDHTSYTQSRSESFVRRKWAWFTSKTAHIHIHHIATIPEKMFAHSVIPIDALTKRYSAARANSGNTRNNSWSFAPHKFTVRTFPEKTWEHWHHLWRKLQAQYDEHWDAACGTRSDLKDAAMSHTT